jgi:hypothetical protein
MVHRQASRGCGDLGIGFEALFTRVSRVHSSGIPSVPRTLGSYWLLQLSNRLPIRFSLPSGPRELCTFFVKMSTNTFSRTVFLYNVFGFRVITKFVIATLRNAKFNLVWKTYFGTHFNLHSRNLPMKFQMYSKYFFPKIRLQIPPPPLYF